MLENKLKRKDNELWTSYIIRSLGEEKIYVEPYRIHTDNIEDGLWYESNAHLYDSEEEMEKDNMKLKKSEFGLWLYANSDNLIKDAKKQILWPPARCEDIPGYTGESVSIFIDSSKVSDENFRVSFEFNEDNDVKVISESDVIILYNPDPLSKYDTLMTACEHKPQEVANFLIEYAKNPVRVFKYSKYALSGEKKFNSLF